MKHEKLGKLLTCAIACAAVWTAASVGTARSALLATSPATAATQPQPLVLDLRDHVTLALQPIPAGKFTMGSPGVEPGRAEDEAQHQVTITKPFFIGRTMVTQAQYQAVMGVNPSQVNHGGQYPVDSVSWNDAEAFCKKLSQQTDEAVSLPTEAQWEYACRAGTNTRFFCGDNENMLRRYALFWARTDLPVGHFKPNPWGLYDMLGLLHEWCEDVYAPYGQAATEPADAGGSQRVLRGGCFHNSARFCRCASRVHYPPDEADYDFGFRIVINPRPATSQPVKRPPPQVVR